MGMKRQNRALTILETNLPGKLMNLGWQHLFCIFRTFLGVLKASGLKTKVWPFSINQNSLLRPIKGNAILFINVHPNASPIRVAAMSDIPYSKVRCSVPPNSSTSDPSTGKRSHLIQKTLSAPMKMKAAPNGLRLGNVKEIWSLWLALLIIMGHVGRAVMCAEAMRDYGEHKNDFANILGYLAQGLQDHLEPF